MYNDFINRLTSTSPETTDQSDGAESGILKKASMSQGDDDQGYCNMPPTTHEELLGGATCFFF